MNTQAKAGPSPGRARHKYRFHWHVLLIHFPISAFLGAFLFMTMHLISGQSCYSLAAYVSLIAGALVMLPTTATGWFTWRHRYKGVKGKLFRNKIRIAFSMVALSIAMAVYQTVYPLRSADIPHDFWYFIYYGGVVLLMLGAVGEGYYGGRLHHH